MYRKLNKERHLENLSGFRCKNLQTAGEPRRFALYFIAELAFSYRLNAVCSFFPLRQTDFHMTYVIHFILLI